MPESIPVTPIIFRKISHSSLSKYNSSCLLHTVIYLEGPSDSKEGGRTDLRNFALLHEISTFKKEEEEEELTVRDTKTQRSRSFEYLLMILYRPSI